MFEESLWPHLRAAYNFARWLAGNDHDAEDIVQESFLKAFTALADFRGSDARPWLLAIVRNTAMNLLRKRHSEKVVPWRSELPDPPDTGPSPERRLQIRKAIQSLPEDFRETLVLRELEGLSYKEIAAVTKAPIGTVMSRLSRARALLLEQLR
jgi:RNA polymerase sigma-70 factor (ECF subfamily)